MAVNENRGINEVQNKLDKNELTFEHAIWEEQNKLLNERISLQEQLKKETNDLLILEKERRNGLMSELKGYVFSFREDGSIEGYGQKIEELKYSLTENEFDDLNTYNL